MTRRRVGITTVLPETTMTQSSTAVPSFDMIAHITSLVVEHGWGTATDIANVIPQSSTKSRSPNAALRFLSQLVDHEVLTREQLRELYVLLQHQDKLPSFRLIRKIGSGGMGTVYLATQLTTDRIIALKIYNGSYTEDADVNNWLQRESNVLIGLNHRNIAEVVEIGKCNGVTYMAMEYINGPSLETLLNANHVLPELYVLRICRQVAAGLAYISTRSNLVHRDIKPSNVLILRTKNDTWNRLLRDDIAKVIDFDLLQPADTVKRQSQSRWAYGTAIYMSPEQVRGEMIDCRSDIYSLSATMYRLLTGKELFPDVDDDSIMDAHLSNAIPDPCCLVPSLLPQTRDLIMRGLEKSAADRYPCFNSFGRALEEAISILENTAYSTHHILRKPLIRIVPMHTGAPKASLKRYEYNSETRIIPAITHKMDLDNLQSHCSKRKSMAIWKMLLPMFREAPTISLPRRLTASTPSNPLAPRAKALRRGSNRLINGSGFLRKGLPVPDLPSIVRQSHIVAIDTNRDDRTTDTVSTDPSSTTAIRTDSHSRHAKRWGSGSGALTANHRRLGSIPRALGCIFACAALVWWLFLG